MTYEEKGTDMEAFLQSVFERGESSLLWLAIAVLHEISKGGETGKIYLSTEGLPA